MPRFYFHLVDGVDQLLDPHGVNMPAEAVVRAALLEARDCMAGDVKSGKINFNYRIEVHDEHGKPVHSLSFRDAVEVVAAS